MARPRKDRFWQELVYGLMETSPRPSPASIAEELEVIAEREKRTDAPPSERTIARWQQHERPEGERLLYRQFRWPEAMIQGALPWEASETSLDLLAYLRREKGVGRPLIGVVKWFWRVSVARPDAPLALRHEAACQLAAWEIAGISESTAARAVEWRLVYRPWRSEADREALEATAGVATEGEPGHPWQLEAIPPLDTAALHLSAETDIDTALDAIEALQGLPLSAFHRRGLREVLTGEYRNQEQATEEGES